MCRKSEGSELRAWASLLEASCAWGAKLREARRPGPRCARIRLSDTEESSRELSRALCIRGCSPHGDVSTSRPPLVVVLRPQMGDQLLAHHPAQRVFQFDQL